MKCKGCGENIKSLLVDCESRKYHKVVMCNNKICVRYHKWIKDDTKTD